MNRKVKKFISAILSLVMIFSLMGGLSGIAYADLFGYNATTTMANLTKLGRDAEEGEIFRISSVTELRQLAEYVNSGKPTEGVTFYMNTDIDLTDEDWTPIGSSVMTPFKGIFDACGFAILNFRESDCEIFGLFGYVSGEKSVIKNLGIRGEITGQSYLGGIAAHVDGGMIANCWASVNITGVSNVGGIVGYIENGSIHNCCSYGYVNGIGSVGAIAGYAVDSTVDYSYYVYYTADTACGRVDGDSVIDVNRFAGSSTEALVEKIITIDSKTTDDLVILLNEWVDEQKNKENYFDWIFDNSAGGAARTGGRCPSHKYPGYIEVAADLYHATSTMTGLYDSGNDAQEGGYYSIASADELYAFASYVNEGRLTEGVTFYMVSDVLIQTGIADYNEIEWFPVGEDDDIPFCGIFDGQGYIIEGVMVFNGNHKGLFGYVDSPNAVIKNIGVNGVYTCNDYVGGIVAHLVNGSVMNSWFGGTIIADDTLGGIAAVCENGTILNCCCFADISGSTRIGAIAGETSTASTIKYCYYGSNFDGPCGDDKATVSAVAAYRENGTEYTLERSVYVGGNNSVMLLNALNHWVRDAAPDNRSFRFWKIDDSAESVIRVVGLHPTHLFPGDSSGLKQAMEPEDTVNTGGNPYDVNYVETATMTELYNSGKNGIAGGHYSISSGDEMKYLADYVNAGHATRDITFYMTQDISIAYQCTGNGGDGWYPIARDADLTQPGMLLRAFRGTFDGCGYTVLGLFLTNEKGDEFGLFGQITGATIKNVGIIGDMVGELKCGGIVGEARDSKIINCWSAVNIQCEAKVGGIVGYATNTDIINCVSYGAMLAYGGRSTFAGGIVGETAGKCNIDNCFYFKTVCSHPYAEISSNTVENIIGFTYGFIGDDFVCDLERAASVDGLNTTNLLTALNTWVASQNTGIYSAWSNSSIPIIVNGATGHFPILMKPNLKDSEYNADYDGDYEATCTMYQLYSMRSDAIEGGCYSINGLDDLEALQKYVADGYRTEGIIFFMTRDVDMSQKYSAGSSLSWKPIGDSDEPFKGIFDGQGYTVKYLYINTGNDDQGLFGHITARNAVVKNLGVSGIIRAGKNAGAICGDFGLGTIANCWCSCEVTALDNNAGGIVGFSNLGHIVNCANYGVVINTAEFGAIAGYALNTNIEYCYYLYATCMRPYGIASIVNTNGVCYFNGTSMACILEKKVDVAGTQTRNALSALKLYVDAHPESNYCYWTVGNTDEYMLMGVEFFPVLISASGTMGGKDYRTTQAYYNGAEYYSLVKAVDAANDNPNGGDVTLATNIVLYDKEDIKPNENVRIVTGDYTLNIKANAYLFNMQQLDGYVIVNKDGGCISLYDYAEADYKRFLYANKEADPSCNSAIFSTESLTLKSEPVSGDYPDAYNLTLQDGEFIVNSTLLGGNPHGIPSGSTITIESRAILNVLSNAKLRTTGGTSKIMNNGTVKIGNATLERNGGIRMLGVFEDDRGTVSLPFIYRDGYTLRGWTDGKTLYKAGSKVSVTEPTTLSASWQIGDGKDAYPGDHYYDNGDGPIYNIPIITVTSDNGTVSPTSTYAAKGENIRFTFNPELAYYLKNVLDNGQTADVDVNRNYDLVSIFDSHTIVAMFAPVTVPDYYTWENCFEDVNTNDWFFDNVRFVNSAGLFKGTEDTLFSPEETMTREMVVTVLWRLAGRPSMPDSGKVFLDVPSDSYAYDAIYWGSAFGIVLGVDENNFGYGEPVTREQLVTFLYRFAKNYAGDDVSQYDSVNILGYEDVLQISKGMTQPFQWAVGAGIVKGTTDTTLGPGDPCTRAQVAAILHRYCNSFILQGPVVNPDLEL